MRISDWSSDVCSSDLDKEEYKNKAMEYLAYVNQQESKGIPPPPDLAYDDLKEWQLYRIDVENTSALFSRGAPIPVGSHSIAPQGRSFHWELWSMEIEGAHG